MNLTLTGINAPGLWTLLSWAAALLLHFTGSAPGTQQVVDAVAGLVTAAHVGGSHVSSPKGGTQ